MVPLWLVIVLVLAFVVFMWYYLTKKCDLEMHVGDLQNVVYNQNRVIEGKETEIAALKSEAQVQDLSRKTAQRAMKTVAWRTRLKGLPRWKFIETPPEPNTDLEVDELIVKPKTI